MKRRDDASSVTMPTAEGVRGAVGTAKRACLAEALGRRVGIWVSERSYAESEGSFAGLGSAAWTAALLFLSALFAPLRFIPRFQFSIRHSAFSLQPLACPFSVPSVVSCKMPFSLRLRASAFEKSASH